MNDIVTNDQGKYKICLITGNDPCHKNLSVIENIIGQDEARRKLCFFIESHSTDVPLPTMLFNGSKGLGKSHTASKASEAMGRELIEVNCESIQTEQEFIEGVLFDQVAGSKSKTILLDEAHRLTKAVANVLLTFLNPNITNRNFYNYNGWDIEYDFSKINIIFATTDAHRMIGPLLNRCEDIYFHLYSDDELFKIIQLYLPTIRIRCGKNELAAACRGRARNAFKLSQHILRYCSMNGTRVFNAKGWKAIKDVFAIYPLGLNSQEIILLQLLKNYSPLSCRNIAVRMGVNEQNVEGELEIRVRELGLIENTSRGRLLTPEGLKYIERIQS